jgi:hypothetical protein
MVMISNYNTCRSIALAISCARTDTLSANSVLHYGIASLEILPPTIATGLFPHLLLLHV